MRRRLIAILVPLVGMTACGDSSSNPTDDCNAETLPLSAATAGPTIVDIHLEVQPSGIVILATATDPQGTANLLNIVQSVGIFPDRRCEGSPIMRTDDLSGSGVEESLVEADFRDADDNRVSGRLFASVLPQP